MKTSASNSSIDYNVNKTTTSNNNSIDVGTDTATGQSFNSPSIKNPSPTETIDLSGEVEPEEPKGILESIGDGIKDAGAKVANGFKSATGWAIDGLKGAGATLAESVSNFANDVETITSKAWDLVDSNPVTSAIADFYSTKAVVVTSAISGILKIGEKIEDGREWLFEKNLSAGAWVAEKAVGIFSKDTAEKIHNWSEDISTRIKEDIARDKVGELNEFFYEKTEMGRRINAHSAIKYDSVVAKRIQGITTTVVEIAAATALTIASGGAAAPFLVGFLAGTGAAAESTYQNNGTDTSFLQELGIGISGGVTGLAWVANGKLGQGALNIAKDFGQKVIVERGGLTAIKGMTKQLVNKEFILNKLKESLSLKKVVDIGVKDGVKQVATKFNFNALMNYVQAAMGTSGSLTPYITGEEEFDATAALKIGGTYLKYLGLNVLEDMARDAVSGYNPIEEPKILTDAERAELAAIPNPTYASATGPGIDTSVTDKLDDLEDIPVKGGQSLGEAGVIKRPEYFEEISSKIKTERIDDQVRDISKRLDLPEDEVRKILDEKIIELLDDSEYGVRVGESTLEKIFDEDGMFKSQFETGYSEGEFDPSFRKAVESRLFGIPTDIDVQDRPVYGMAFPKLDDPDLADYVSDGPGSQYGLEDGIVAIFDKEKVKDSLTYTLGDSLDSEKFISAGLVTNPSFTAGSTGGYGLSSFARGIYEAEDLSKAKLTTLFNGDWESYLEIQFHGRETHSIENLSHILFTSEPSDSLLQKIIEKGIPYTILGE